MVFRRHERTAVVKFVVVAMVALVVLVAGFGFKAYGLGFRLVWQARHTIVVFFDP